MNKKKWMIKKEKWTRECLNGSGKCEICGEKILYFCKYDADFCKHCNIWISPHCEDPLCTFCRLRPETPEHAIAECYVTLNYERDFYDRQKEKAMKYFLANKKYRKKQNKMKYKRGFLRWILD